VTLAPPMARPLKTHLRDLTGAARQANHVLAAAVVVFTAGILLQRLVSPWMVSLSVWLTSVMGAATAATVFGPLIVDLPKALLLLGVAFPLGRITMPRPWPTGIGLVGLVYLFDFGVHFVFGTHVILYGHWRAILGRGLLLALVLWGVVWLVKRGCWAAETADRQGTLPDKEPKTKKKDKGETTGRSGAGAASKSPKSGTEDDQTCKQHTSDSVTEGER